VFVRYQALYRSVQGHHEVSRGSLTSERLLIAKEIDHALQLYTRRENTQLICMQEPESGVLRAFNPCPFTFLLKQFIGDTARKKEIAEQ
jgi:hypothetical protein